MTPRKPTNDDVLEDEILDDALEAEGEAAVKVDNPTTPTGEVVWMRHPNGLAHEVVSGTEAHKRLVEAGAAVIDEPTDDDREVTDFAMLEKQKADASGSRR